MKKIKLIFLIMFVLFLNLILTSCTKFPNNYDMPLSLNFSNEFKDIYETLIKSVYCKSKLSLVAPKKGENKLAINTLTDNLKRTFAVVFYKIENEQINFQNRLRMAILQKSKNNQWQFKVDFPCKGDSVEKIMFVKNKNNPNHFMIVGYSQKSSIHPCNYKGHKHLNIFELDPSNIHKIKIRTSKHESNFFNNTLDNLCYKSMNLCALDGNDSNKQLVIISNCLFKRSFDCIHAFSINSNEITQIDDISKPICLNFSFMHDIKIDTKSFETPILIVDEKSVSENEFSTEAFIFKNNAFERIYHSPVRKFFPDSFDFDDDGCIEIPTTTFFAGQNSTRLYENETLHQRSFQKFPPLITTWNKLKFVKNNFITLPTKTYCNLTHGFGFKLPASWNEQNVSARYTEKQNTVDFFEFNKNLNNNFIKLLTIKASNSKKSELFDFFNLKNVGPFSFWAKIYNSNLLYSKNLAISRQELYNMFFILKNYPKEGELN